MQTIRHGSWLGVFLFTAMCLAMPAAAGDPQDTDPSGAAASSLARDTIGKITGVGGFHVASGSVSGLGYLLDNWDTLKNPCPCTLKLLEAMFKGLRDGEGQSFAFVMSDCFKLPQLGGGTFAELQYQGEYLSNDLARNKTKNLNTLRQMINEVRAACAVPAQTQSPPPTTSPYPPTAPPPATPPRTAPPPPPPPPPPVKLPPPPTPAWTVANPCPACQEWADLLARERANLEVIGKEMADLEAKLPPLNAQQQKLRGAIRSLEAQLASQQGTGGSSLDPETGIRIEAVTDAKGTVHVTTRDANGNIIEQHTRERRDAGKIKEEINARQAGLDGLNDQEAQIRKDFDYKFAERTKVERAIKAAQEGLEDCIRTKCYAQTSARPDDRSVVPTPAPMSAMLADSARMETAATPCPECAAEAARAKAALDNLRILLNIPAELRDTVTYDAQVKVATKAADEAYSYYRQCAYQRCRVMVDPEKPSPDEQGTPPSLQLRTDNESNRESILDSIDDREAALEVSIGGGPVKEKVPENPLAGTTIIDKAGGGMERIDPPVCPKPPANQPMVIGANASVGSGAQARDKMQQKVGSLIGSLIGGHSSSGSGGSSGNQPRTDRDPISGKDKQAFTAPDGTRIRIGGKMTPRGPLISIEIVDSPGGGTFQTVYLEDAEGRRAGPLQYWIYEMYRDWTLTVSWTRDTYVNDQHVSHEEGGWSEQGRDFLGRFKVPQANEGIWKRMGFNNATKGVKAVGVVFPNPMQAIAMGPLATALVLHLSRPREDPVVTTPFIFNMAATPEGKLVFQQMQRTPVQERCRDQ